MEIRNPDFINYVKSKIRLNKYMQHLGFEIYEIKHGETRGRLEMKELHHQQNGFLHGGVISALCDMAGGFAAYSVVAPDEFVFTVEIKVSYFNPGKAKNYEVIGKVVKAGKRFCFCESEIVDEHQQIIAKSTMTMAVRKADRSVSGNNK